MAWATSWYFPFALEKMKWKPPEFLRFICLSWFSPFLMATQPVTQTGCPGHPVPTSYCPSLWAVCSFFLLTSGCKTSWNDREPQRPMGRCRQQLCSDVQLPDTMGSLWPCGWLKKVCIYIHIYIYIYIHKHYIYSIQYIYNIIKLYIKYFFSVFPGKSATASPALRNRDRR